MGLIRGIKNTYKKSESSLVVKELLMRQAKAGMLTLDPNKLSFDLINSVWYQMPDVFGGKFGQSPHKLAVAAAALANGVEQYKSDDPIRRALILSLGNVLSELETNGPLYPLNSLDQEVIRAAESIFSEVATEIVDRKSGATAPTEHKAEALGKQFLESLDTSLELIWKNGERVDQESRARAEQYVKFILVSAEVATEKLFQCMYGKSITSSSDDEVEPIATEVLVFHYFAAVRLAFNIFDESKYEQYRDALNAELLRQPNNRNYSKLLFMTIHDRETLYSKARAPKFLPGEDGVLDGTMAGELMKDLLARHSVDDPAVKSCCAEMAKVLPMAVIAHFVESKLLQPGSVLIKDSRSRN